MKLSMRKRFSISLRVRVVRDGRVVGTEVFCVLGQKYLVNMRRLLQFFSTICLFVALGYLILECNGTFLPNLSESCYRCLCHVATKCDTSHECTGGYCGPYNISRVYWIDAGRITLPDDDPERNHAWQDCARSYHCAKRIIEGYLEKFGKDCNGDGVTNCFDYMMVNGNGGYGCTPPLNRSVNGRRWLTRYEECQHSLT